MNIVSYLINYLNIHHAVVVNDLGTFYLKRMSGFYEADTKVLYPPKLIVTFNESKTENDDFAHYLSEALDIDIEKAIYHVEKFVRDIKNSLNQNGVFKLSVLGELKFANNRIKFNADHHQNFLKIFYGLTPISYTINQVEVYDEIVENVEQNVLSQTVVNYSLAEQALKSIAPEPLKVPNEKNNFFQTTIIILILSLIVVGIYYFFFPMKPFDNHFSHVKNISEKPLDTIENTISDNFEESAKANVVLGADTTFYYEIIILNKVQNNKIAKLLSSLKNNGLTNAHSVALKDTNFKKISAQKFGNLDSAEKSLSAVKQNFYPKAYIETIKSIN